MRYRELTETKWWEDKPTITLFHGTSSALVQHIREHGLRPPREDLLEYALDILREYIPEEQWTTDLVDDIKRRAARTDMGRNGDKGAVIFCFTQAQDVKGYAESYAEHGGEIAYDVFISACMFLSPPDITHREFMANLPLKPRYADASPVVVEVEVPRDWIVSDLDFNLIKDKIGNNQTKLDKILSSREIRITKTVPVDMITSITPVSREIKESSRNYAHPSGAEIRIWKNPSIGEISQAMKSSRYQCLRGLVARHTDEMWVWDAYMATHSEVCDTIGVPYVNEDDNFIFLLSRNESVLSSESDWLEGEVYRTERGAFYLLAPDEFIRRSSRTNRIFGELIFMSDHVVE